MFRQTNPGSLTERRQRSARHRWLVVLASVAILAALLPATVVSAAPNPAADPESPGTAASAGTAVAESADAPTGARAGVSAAAQGVAPAADPTTPVSATTGGGPTLDQVVGHGATTLRDGTPRQAHLIEQYADRIPVDAAHGSDPGTGVDGHALYPGSVVLAARNGVVAEYAAEGYNLRYADQQGTELPRAQWIPTTKDTIYDLASLSKLFTTIVAMQLVDHHELNLDAAVASYLPAFAQNGKQDITIRQLLTHSSGLPPDPSPGLWTYPTRQQKVDAVYATVLQAAPGSTYIYSDLNMITLQFVEESITGKTLDVLVHNGITGPLRMTDTMYNPPAALKYRVAAQEYQLTPNRGLVWGQVHDENSWALDGVAGHAGVFSTAHDLAILCQMMLNGGRYGGARILSRASVLAMLSDSPAIPGPNGLGFELYQQWYMNGLATPYTFGHTGFTGTSLVIDPTTKSFVILLTNHVHPSRNWGSVNPPRRDVADDLARAVGVQPRQGGTAWFAGMADRTTTTLTVPLTLPASSRLDFGLWYDTEPEYDFVRLEASNDAGTTWTQVPFTLRGRNLDVQTTGAISGYEGHQWLRAQADLSSLTGAVQLRWRYTTDNLYHGRGVYVDAVSIRAGHTVVFNDRRPGDAAAFQPDGWVSSRD
ncbi:serine hydrolase [Nakamurella lactea]|uniref:serine hydrolase n=1 Tax=Nakamurella lactea TaxID=459515 RepID=UPI000684EA0B|nr:serine hydrolase [Nakamurella lactea]